MNRWAVTVSLVGFALTIFSIWYSWYLAEPARLEVWHELNETSGRLNIWIKNIGIKDTGTIYFYRLEANPDKPHVVLNSSLAPNQTRQLGFAIKVEERNITALEPRMCSMPAYGVYFATDKDLSISYKIECDSCRGSIIRRIPPYDQIKMTTQVQSINDTIFCQVSVIDYSWEEIGIRNLTNKTL